MVRPSGSTQADRAVVHEINLRQRHRGPDDAGSWSGEGAVLGHTRLAIIDLTDRGRQPFVGQDGSVAIVFNGEIYNHVEIRRRHGLVTQDRCDGAILPELWSRLGTSMFAELRGMYAIAVYEANSRTLTLARDPFGIKPFYWTRTADGAIAFASEPRCLLRLVPHPRMSREALRHYLTFGSLSRDGSPFEGVNSVPANTWVQWGAASLPEQAPKRGVIQKDLLHGPRPMTRAMLRDELLRSVSAHLTSDVPVALLLSSGLDSSAIAWACAELGVKLDCVTVDMGGDISERAAASEVAARFGHRHESISRAPDAELVEQYFGAMQRPSIDGLNTFLVSRSIAGLGIKVALSGLGGDELLAGYRAFRLLRYLTLLRAADTLSLTTLTGKACAGLKPKMAQLLHRDGPRDAAGLAVLMRRVLMEEQVAALSLGPLPAIRMPSMTIGTSARALTAAEIDGYLGGTLLPDTDAFSMAWSVELRLPYVDVPFARVAAEVAPRSGVGKRGFAAALADPELRRIARRRKRGFTLPMDRWMRDGPLAPLVKLAQTPAAPVRTLLRGESVDRLIDGWARGLHSWSRAWLVVSLDGWLRTIGTDLEPTGDDLCG